MPMDLLPVIKSAFHDELDKIAGSMQGHTRAGRRPISVEKLLDKEHVKSTTEKVSDIVKVGSGAEQVAQAASGYLKRKSLTLGATAVGGAASGYLKRKSLTLGATAVGGAATYALAHQANEDRKMGRQLRRQQTQQGY